MGLLGAITIEASGRTSSTRWTRKRPGSSTGIMCAEFSNHTIFFPGAFTCASHSAATEEAVV